MPKIFVLRHQLAEQQKKLRQDDKGASGEASNSPPLSPEQEDSNKYEASKNVQPPEVLPIRPPSGLVIQPIPAPSSSTASLASAVASSSSVSIIPSTQPSASGKTLFFIYQIQ